MTSAHKKAPQDIQKDKDAKRGKHSVKETSCTADNTAATKECKARLDGKCNKDSDANERKERKDGCGRARAKDYQPHAAWTEAGRDSPAPGTDSGRGVSGDANVQARGEQRVRRHREGCADKGSGVKAVVVNEWHIECLVCRVQYYLVDYPKSGCKNCGRDALLITDHRVDKGVDRGVDCGAEQA